MKNKLISIIALTVAAIFSVAVFAIFKSKSFATVSQEEQSRRVAKKNETVLPNGVGKNLLAKKSFYISDDDFALEWNFTGDENLEVLETVSIDGFFPLETKWAANYSFDESQGLLYIKRMSLVNCSPDFTSIEIEDFLAKDFYENLNLFFNSTGADEKLSLEDLILERTVQYVEKNLYEIETFKVDVNGEGLLCESQGRNFGLLQLGRTYKAGDVPFEIYEKHGNLGIENWIDGERHFYGGTVHMDGQRLESVLYEFRRDKLKKTATVLPVGKFVADLTESEVLSDFQQSVRELTVVEAPQELKLSRGTRFVSKSSLHPYLYWMNENKDGL